MSERSDLAALSRRVNDLGEEVHQLFLTDAVHPTDKTQRALVSGLRSLNTEVENLHELLRVYHRRLQRELENANMALADRQAEEAREHPTAAQAGPSLPFGQVPYAPRKPTSVCPSCFRQFVLTGANPGGICTFCRPRRQTWAAPPRAGPIFYPGRRY